jgi:nicotinamide phosphoribosyltransferase
MGIRDIRKNRLEHTDSYNVSHQGLKENTDWEVSHLYNRTEGQILYGHNETVGDVLLEPVTEEEVFSFKRTSEAQGLNPKRILEKWNIILKEFNGNLPLRVEALPDGTWCPAGTPFSQISNTVKDFGELVTWWEPRYMHNAFSSGCATNAFHMRRYLERKQREYGYDDSFLWKFHFFGYRGNTSLETAYWSGTAWNLRLLGTDDLSAKYHTPGAQVGSIPASAHKVLQQFDDEFYGLKRAIIVTSEDGGVIVAQPIDTYDADRVINEYLVTLAAVGRSHNVHIVMRPDSGDTWGQAVAIYKKCKSSGIRNVSVIIGENMSFDNAKKADVFFESMGIPLDFVFYGIGGGFYKHIDRDTHGWAMKTAYSNGADRMKFGMTPLKQSIPGRVNVAMNSLGALTVVPYDSEESALQGQYKTIYEWAPGLDKPFYQKQSWDDIQAITAQQDPTQEIIRIHPAIADKIDALRIKHNVRR